jgi:hypothetical protein
MPVGRRFIVVLSNWVGKPFSYPPKQTPLDLATAEKYEAVRLFLARVRATQPNFSQVVQKLTNKLGEENFTLHRQIGQNLSFEQILENLGNQLF